jgi:hypothetical protein
MSGKIDQSARQNDNQNIGGNVEIPVEALGAYDKKCRFVTSCPDDRRTQLERARIQDKYGASKWSNQLFVQRGGPSQRKKRKSQETYDHGGDYDSRKDNTHISDLKDARESGQPRTGVTETKRICENSGGTHDQPAS